MNMLKVNILTHGGWIQTGSIAIAEIMASTGHFDWICIDMEHGLVGTMERLASLISVIENYNVIPVVRVPKNDHKWIGRSLDMGAKGIIVPMVNSALEAEFAVASVKYPPKGKRSFGYSRSNGFGLTFEDSLKDEIALMVQIEHHEAVKNLEAILRVDGIDGTFLGPLDLKGSIDINMDDIMFDKWMDKYLRTCNDAGSPAGIHCVNPSREEINRLERLGYKIIAVGTDAVLLRQGMEAVL